MIWKFLSEEAENKKLLEEGLKEGVVEMRYIVYITIGLCRKY